MVVSDLIRCYADVFEYFKQCFSIVSECNGSVMWIAFFDQLMTIESSHLRNREDTDATEGTGSNRKYFTVCHISAQFSVSRTLQTEECDISRYDISLSLIHISEPTRRS